MILGGRGERRGVSLLLGGFILATSVAVGAAWQATSTGSTLGQVEDDHEQGKEDRKSRVTDALCLDFDCCIADCDDCDGGCDCGVSATSGAARGRGEAGRLARVGREGRRGRTGWRYAGSLVVLLLPLLALLLWRRRILARQGDAG